MTNITMQKPAPTYSPISAVLYSIITLLLLPVTILGYIVWVGGAIFAGRGSGVSGTAQGPLSRASSSTISGCAETKQRTS
jgi:hypothetical protein